MANAQNKAVFRATSVSLFLAKIEELKKIEVESGNDADFIFRGQRTRDPLIPRIARLKPKGKMVEVERLMMEEFERQILPFVDHEPHGPWDLLALAQHHHLPTRLLDWTYSALAALWFCVEQSPVIDKSGFNDGVVWIFKTTKEDFVDFQTDENPYSPSRTRIFRPRFISRRIMAQSGLFTCHKRTKEGSFVPLEKNKNYKQRLVMIDIAGDKFSCMKEQLWTSGITNLALFPDLDGLTGNLEMRYFHSPKSVQNR